MTQPSPDFHRTNINLHASDVRWFQDHYGYGWTERVRDLIHNWVLNEGHLEETATDDNSYEASMARWNKALRR